MKARLKVVAGYFQFGSDYLGEGEWEGNSLLLVVSMATHHTVQMNSLSGGTAELDDMEECAAFRANHKSCNIVFLSYILEGLF